jgi:putative restriction endonuclease
MTKPIIFGEIEGIDEGQWFKDRREMMPTSFHRYWGAGIDGNRGEGCCSSIVLNGGHVDYFNMGEDSICISYGRNDSRSKG